MGGVIELGTTDLVSLYHRVIIIIIIWSHLMMGPEGIWAWGLGPMVGNRAGSEATYRSCSILSFTSY